MVARSYAPEFRRRVVELVRSGRAVSVVAADTGVSEATVYRWREQDRVDRGERPGLSSVERTELAVARRRIRELETELEIMRKASALFAESEVRPKGSSRLLLLWPGRATTSSAAAESLVWRRQAISAGGVDRSRRWSCGASGCEG